ncbi:MAG: MFS transporter [Propionibacteriaceae bacterium]|jgi:DHA3 family macrolide efflux protein-like MFS transporter|nr:MFS transporter [Propionibacteriaceae bacterium]
MVKWRRNAVLYMAGQVLSQFGSAVVAYAIIWNIALNQDTTAYALCVMAANLPIALLSIPAGVWADRYNRKWLIVAPDAGIAVATVVLALAWLAGTTDLWLILIVLVLRGTGAGIQSPAAMAAIPMLVPEKHLLRFNSVNGALQYAVYIVAPALAAALIAFMPLGQILFIDVTTALIGIAFVLPLPLKAVEQSEHVGYFLGTLAALKYLRRSRVLWRAMLLVAPVMLIVVAPVGYSPIFIKDCFGTDTWMLAAVEMVFSIGAIAGGAVLAVWGGLKNRMAMMLIVSFAFAVFTLLLGWSPNIWWFIAFTTVYGIAVPGIETVGNTVLQENTDETMLGRMMSLMNVMMAVAYPVGMGLLAPLVEGIGIRGAFYVCGVLGLVVALANSCRAPKILPPGTTE